MASNGFDPNQARDKDGKWTDEGAEKADKSPKGYDSRKDMTVKRAKDAIENKQQNK